MIFRETVIKTAILECLKELYSYAVPKVTWEEFTEENKLYSSKYEHWKHYTNAFNDRENNPKLWLQYKISFSDWENKSVEECIGPKPYEFYYLPKEIINDIVNSYIYAYRLDQQQELFDTIEILKNYCKNPIVDKYIKKEGESGYRGYEHPDNLEKELYQILKEYFNDSETDPNAIAKELQDKFFEFLDMAGNFYNWNSELNAFNMSIYLGSCPNSNKETVIENWKKYRNQDIEINEEQIKKEYYGEEN